jgi:hypothetical protein
MLNSASVLRSEQVIKPQGGLAPSVHCKKKQQVPPTETPASGSAAFSFVIPTALARPLGMNRFSLD